MKKYLLILMLLSYTGAFAAETEKPVKTVPKKSEASSAQVYHVQIRVIFAGTSGDYGSVPNELSDMKTVLTQGFHYPSFELSNTIRLSLFSDEEATAVVFPDHYLRLIPKGAVGGNSLKVKAEIYHIPMDDAAKIQVYLGNLPQVVGYEEKEKEGQHRPVFPIVSSALLATAQQWEGFGGVPVRVTSQGRVNANTMSSSPLSVSGVNPTLGVQKYLILGVRLEQE